jgi:endonuclease YncB( thermonuclease family)
VFNIELVKEGLSWHYRQFSRDQVLAAAERAAQPARRGLWLDKDPVAPWNWRTQERERRKKRASPER